ncbi:MAG: FAD-dependent oxidoreductase [Phycisphaeraceae bacterium]|nr:FAD-dependent oxidoreductase [Phycisphaeraceae bacterium]
MRKLDHEFDLAVCGGGLAGFCAAVAAARHGSRVALIQDRPVLGGNSSSEIRVTPHGAANFHAYARETGIISELLIEERYRNHEPIMENGGTNSVWDMVLYDTAMREPNLTLFLNTVIQSVRMAEPLPEPPLPETRDGFYHRPSLHADGPGLIRSVRGHVLNSEIELTIAAHHFIDATGDGIVADLAGCQWRMGTEGRDAFGEHHAPEHASTDTMGNSIHIRARDMGRPCPFSAPDWAVHHADPAYFYEQGRVPGDVRGGFWWIEIGVPWHTIHDNATIAHELTRHALGVWDWMKNRDPNLKGHIENYALDWIGQLPGKRESRRIIGQRLMTEHDFWPDKPFTDEIAFGGWFVDLHTPGGLLADKSEPHAAQGYQVEGEMADRAFVGPYGIPLGIMVTKDVRNLMTAGRNISATHAALGSIRVMATTALLGQAAGTFLALNRRSSKPLGTLAERAANTNALQQALLRDGCFLPSAVNQDKNDLARRATIVASSSEKVSGVEQLEAGAHDGLGRWYVPERPEDELLTTRRAQWIAVATDSIKSVSVLLSNLAGKTQSVEAILCPVQSIWDYRTEPDAFVARAKLEIPPGGPHWIDWPLPDDHSGSIKPGTYLRLDLLPQPKVAWHLAQRKLIPGHPSAYAASPRLMRRYHSGQTLCFGIQPAQPCFEPGQVISGVTRPCRFTNLWRSDPNLRGPAWLDLHWDRQQTINVVELTFPGHLVREYHAYGPFYADPQTARDYLLGAWVNGVWTTLASCKGNYQRHRIHRFSVPVRTDRLRLIIQSTHGDPSAGVHEIRCYRD